MIGEYMSRGKQSARTEEDRREHLGKENKLGELRERK